MITNIGRLAVSALGIVSSRSEDTTAAVDQIDSGSRQTHHGVFGLFNFPSDWGTPHPSFPGQPAFVKFQDPPPVLIKRACLANGTNYCFGDNSHYCLSCGTCCTEGESQFCCPSDGTCCGGSCCGKGQTCRSGQCFSPAVTVTISSTVEATVSHATTRTETVVLTVFDTSTINTIVDVTITSADTQTDWSYITVTTVGKRDAPTTSSKPTAQLPVNDPVPQLRRQATRLPTATETSTTTITKLVTQTKDVTSAATTQVTSTTTSLVKTTDTRTNTKVLSAQTTVTSTSTLTYTSHNPVTATRTILATSPVDTTTSSTSTSTQPPSLQTDGASASTTQHKKGLKAGAIAGVAIGSALFAALIAAAVYLAIRWRRAKAVRQQQYEDAFFGLNDENPVVGPGYGHMSMTQPVSVAGTVAPSVVPSSSRNNPDLMAARGGASSHHRTGSGFTGSTAVTGLDGGGSGSGGGGAAKKSRISMISTGPGAGGGGGGYMDTGLSVGGDTPPDMGDINGVGGSVTPAAGLPTSPPRPGKGFYRDF